MLGRKLICYWWEPSAYRGKEAYHIKTWADQAQIVGFWNWKVTDISTIVKWKSKQTPNHKNRKGYFILKTWPSSRGKFWVTDSNPLIQREN